MSSHPDVLIAGAGVIGLTTAYYLAKAGAAVVVFDQGDLGRQASWAGAGIIPPGEPSRARHPFDHLRGWSSRLYPALSQELLDRTGIDNGHRVCGGIELNDPAQPIDPEAWEQEGIAYEAIDAAALRRRYPELAAHAAGGYYLPDLAQVRNPRHLKALVAACASLGVQFRPGEAVADFERDGSRVFAARTERGSYPASRFLVAAGAWADRLLKPLGCRLGIAPVRGQIVLFHTGIAGIRPVVMHGRDYLVRRADGRVLAGSTEEHVGFDTRTTDDAVRNLTSFAVSLMPALAYADIERSWAGLRPGSPDGLPFLGNLPGYQNIFVAAGHFRAGLQLSPGTALLMKELLLGQPPSMPISAFRPDRSPAPPRQPAFRS